jgi:hypothetical protein
MPTSFILNSLAPAFREHETIFRKEFEIAHMGFTIFLVRVHLVLILSVQVGTPDLPTPRVHLCPVHLPIAPDIDSTRRKSHDSAKSRSGTRLGAACDPGVRAHEHKCAVPSCAKLLNVNGHKGGDKYRIVTHLNKGHVQSLAILRSCAASAVSRVAAWTWLRSSAHSAKVSFHRVVPRVPRPSHPASRITLDGQNEVRRKLPPSRPCMACCVSGRALDIG